MKWLTEHPAIRAGLLMTAILGVYFGVESWLESKRQDEWQASDAAWEQRDIAEKAAMFELLHEIREACGGRLK